MHNRTALAVRHSPTKGESKGSSQRALNLFDHSIAPKLGSSRTAMWRQ